MLYKGINKIKELYKGTNTITKVYKGSNLVYLKNNIPEWVTTNGNYNVGDVLFSPTVSVDSFVVINNLDFIDSLFLNWYEPVGIVVIPTSHDVYGTGECGVMALRAASLQTPDTGTTSNESMYWGSKTYIIPELNTFNEYPRYGTMNSDLPSNTIDGVSKYGYIPTQNSAMSIKCQCSHDPQTSYYNVNDIIFGYLPSPYLADGTRNPDYYKIDNPSSSANALSDFNGKENTRILCENATAQIDWKTTTLIANSNNEGYYPAACACWRFNPGFTRPSNWYLPAIGEMGYIAARYDLINTTINKL